MFKFKLNSVLNLRSNIEDTKKRELKILYEEKKQAEDKLYSIQGQMSITLEALKLSVSKSIRPLEIQSLNVQYKILKQEKEKSISRLNEVLEKIELKRAELTEAVKNRKILENLKGLHFEKYIEEEKYKEQIILDGIVSYKYSQSDRGE